MASLVRPWYVDKKTGAKKRTKNWYGQYTDAAGKRCRVPLSTNKVAAQTMLADLLRRVERERAGLVTAAEADHQSRPLADHLTAWERELNAAAAEGAAGRKHVANLLRCVRRVLDGTGAVFARDLDPTRVREYLAELRADRDVDPVPDKEWFTRGELAALLGCGVSNVSSLLMRHRLAGEGNGRNRRYPRTTAEALVGMSARGMSAAAANDHLAAAQQFARWMKAGGRAAPGQVDGLLGIDPANAEADRRHERRVLSVDELRRLMAAARASGRVFRGLPGPDRAVLYLVAMSTGFRAGELAALTPLCFALDDGNPRVGLSAGETKNDAEADQPLPPDVAAEVRAYLAGKGGRVLLWPGTWSDRAADMIRKDLEDAGIPYAVEGRDGPLVADLHALRGSYIVLLERAGATLREAMTLARHSDPKLTLKVYGRLSRSEVRDAVNRLPGLAEPPPLAPRLAPKLAPTADDDCGPVRTDAPETEPAPDAEPPVLEGIEDAGGPVRTTEEAPLH